MHETYDFGPSDENRIVYVREVAVADLPEDVQEQVEDTDVLYAVHSADGERLALVKEYRLAFSLAREHDYAPVPVH